MTDNIQAPTSNVPAQKEIVEKIASEVKTEEAEKEEEKIRDKIAKKVSQNILDIAKKVIKSDKNEVPKEKTDTHPGEPLSPMKLIKILGLVILVVVIFFGMYVRFFWKKPAQNSKVNSSATPTYLPFQNFKPSVYAQDSVLLQLEETVNVLDREISTTPLSETTLTPPALDFNVVFK
jgi:hypothetical protein